MAYIYKITNLINNKIYIGETIRSIQVRWNEHKSVCMNEKGHGYNYHLHLAMRKYGIDNFIIEEIEQCKDEERFNRETYYINLYNSNNKEKGYNYVLEGRGNSPYLTQDFLDAWNEGLKIFDIAEKLGCHYSTVSSRLKANGITLEQIKKRTGLYIQERDSKPVEQYSLTGQFIKEYPSAGSCTKDGFQQSAVSNVCNQKQKSAYGFLWKYKEDKKDIQEWVFLYNNKLDAGKPKKKIGQYNLETEELIQIFNSAAEAAKFLKLNDKSCICRAARTLGKSHGYKWRYIEE